MCINVYQSEGTTTGYVGHELTHRPQKYQNRPGKECMDFLKNQAEANKAHIPACGNMIVSAQNSVRREKLS